MKINQLLENNLYKILTGGIKTINKVELRFLLHNYLNIDKNYVLLSKLLNIVFKKIFVNIGEKIMIDPFNFISYINSLGENIKLFESGFLEKIPKPLYLEIFQKELDSFILETDIIQTIISNLHKNKDTMLENLANIYKILKIYKIPLSDDIKNLIKIILSEKNLTVLMLNVNKIILITQNSNSDKYNIISQLRNNLIYIFDLIREIFDDTIFLSLYKHYMIHRLLNTNTNIIYEKYLLSLLPKEPNNIYCSLIMYINDISSSIKMSKYFRNLDFEILNKKYILNDITSKTIKKEKFVFLLKNTYFWNYNNNKIKIPLQLMPYFEIFSNYFEKCYNSYILEYDINNSILDISLQFGKNIIDLELNIPQYAVLLLLQDKKVIRLQEIIDTLEITPIYTMTIINSLLYHNIIYRSSHSKDDLNMEFGFNNNLLITKLSIINTFKSLLDNSFYNISDDNLQIVISDILIKKMTSNLENIIKDINKIYIFVTSDKIKYIIDNLINKNIINYSEVENNYSYNFSYNSKN
jgi:hypothetical protein